MHCFYQALSKRKSLGRPVRIAYFGDSFIEGDILTADLRQLLQKRFGGCGVGFVDTDSPFTKLRASVKHTAGGWVEHNVLKKEGLDMASLGVSQRYAQGGAGAFVEYGGVKDYACLDSFEVATLFLKDGGAPVAVKINNGPNRSFPMVSHGCLSTVTAKPMVFAKLDSPFADAPPAMVWRSKGVTVFRSTISLCAAVAVPRWQAWRRNI